MNDFSYLRQVVLDLISKEKRSLAFELLEFYKTRAKTIGDFDLLGELSLKAEHRDLYFYCANAAYSLCTTNEQLFAARTNLYKACNALNQPEKALFYIDLNLKVKPNDFDLTMNRAFNLALMNKREQAEEIIESLIADHENEEDIRYALSGKMLRNGDTANGILNFIDTFKPKNILFEDHLRMEKWSGQPVEPGTRLYINGEGGVGDEIINIRFMDELKRRGFVPTLYSSWSMYRPDLVDVFRRHGHDVICEYYSIDRSGLWTHMMSLPGYMGLNEDQLWTGTYLTPKRDPKNIITSDKIKVGIKKSGNPYFAQDEYRKIDLDLLVSHIPEHFDIYYIDKERVDHPRVTNLCDKIDTWEDTFDIIDQMDIIVSSCTSLVHAAGAIGKRTVVVVPIAEYYTWTSSRKNNTTPWYGDNFTVLKQTKVRSWLEPLAELQSILNGMTK